MLNRADASPKWLARLARELEEQHLGALVDTIEASVREGVPSYAGLPPTAGFRQGLQRTAITYCRTLAEHRRINDKERVGLHVIGSQRARHGLAPDEVMDAVEVAVVSGWQCSLDVLREMGADAGTIASVAVDAFPLALGFAQDVRSALLFGFRSDGEEPLPAQVRAQAAVIDRLLAGAAADDDLFDVIRSHALDIRPPVGLFVVTGAFGMETTSLRPSARALTRIPKVVEGPARYTAAPPHVILLVSAVDHWPRVQAGAADVARAEGFVVVAPDAPVQRLVDLADAYQAVETDLHLAKRVRSSGGLVLGRTLALYRTLAYIPPQERVELVVQTLGPVLAKRHKGEVYLEAYEAWLEADCDLKRAASVLGEPVHTVRYRLSTVERLSGVSARSSEGRIRLDLAVRLWRGWVRESLIGGADHGS